MTLAPEQHHGNRPSPSLYSKAINLYLWSKALNWSLLHETSLLISGILSLALHSFDSFLSLPTVTYQCLNYLVDIRYLFDLSIQTILQFFLKKAFGFWFSKNLFFCYRIFCHKSPQSLLSIFINVTPWGFCPTLNSLLYMRLLN